MSDKLITAALQTALTKAYPLPEYATFFEVGDATGGRHSRWADAVTMACWPSRGLAITGFELKASRSDWLREKRDVSKSAPVQKYCDRWALFTAPGVVLPGELPELWGHAELVGNRMVWKTQSPQLKPDPLDRSFVASLLRRCGQTSESIVHARVVEATAGARQECDRQIARAVKDATERNSKAVAACQAFKEATGVDLLGRWTMDVAAGPDFAAFRELKQSLRWNQFSATAEKIRKVADGLDAAVTAIHEVVGIDEKEA